MENVQITITETVNNVLVSVVEQVQEVTVIAQTGHPGANIIVSATEPVDPTDGLLWIPIT